MRRILSFILVYFFFLTNCWAGSGSGNVSNVVQYGGGAITSTTAQGIPAQITIPIGSLSSMVTLFAGTSSDTTGNYYGLYSASSPASGSQVIYSVPSGKIFTMISMYYAAGTSDTIQFGYGTAVGSMTEAGSTPPTSPVYYSASSTVSTTPFIQTVAAPAYTYFPVGLSFPATSVPFVRPGGTSGDQFRLMIIGIVQ